MPSPTLATCPRCRGCGDVIGPDGYSATCPRCHGDGRVNVDPWPEPAGRRSRWHQPCRSAAALARLIPGRPATHPELRGLPGWHEGGLRKHVRTYHPDMHLHRTWTGTHPTGAALFTYHLRTEPK